MTKMNDQVILATGEVCAFQDLKVGMLLLDEFSQLRRLHAVSCRKVPAYEIRPMKGPSFLLGFDQTLVARRGRDPVVLPIEAILRQPKSFQTSLTLAKAELDFPDKPLPLDPYLLGLLLGDGCFRGCQPCLTTPDPEIVDAVFSLAMVRGWPLRVVQSIDNLSNTYVFQNTPTVSLKTILQHLTLWGCTSKEKFIPPEYKTASRENRWKLLAGLLDTDGYKRWKSYEIFTASPRLADDIASLARGLGCEVTATLNRQKYHRLYLMGDFRECPLCVARKQIHSAPPKRNLSFTVHEAGLRDVFFLGIESFLMSDGTIRRG